MSAAGRFTEDTVGPLSPPLLKSRPRVRYLMASFERPQWRIRVGEWPVLSSNSQYPLLVESRDCLILLACHKADIEVSLPDGGHR